MLNNNQKRNGELVNRMRSKILLGGVLLFVWGIVQLALNIAPIRGMADSYERPVREEYEYSASIVNARKEDYYIIQTGAFDAVMEEKGEFLTEFEGDLIPDVQTARALGEAFFQNAMREYYAAEEWTVRRVTYDPKQEVWMIKFGPDYLDDYVTEFETVVYVVMRKKDGNVIYVGGFNDIPVEH